MQEYNIEQLENYRGVKGWLLFFCINLIIIFPLVTLIAIIEVTIYSEYYKMFPGLLSYMYIDQIIFILLSVLSIRAGLALWNIKPGAVEIAKNFLLIYLGYSFFSLFLPRFIGLDPTVIDELFPDLAKRTIRGISFCAIWYSYLNVSKRVKATYTSNLVSKEPENISIESEKTNNEEEFECSECHTTVPANAKACPNCGAEFEE